MTVPHWRGPGGRRVRATRATPPVYRRRGLHALLRGADQPPYSYRTAFASYGPACRRVFAYLQVCVLLDWGKSLTMLREFPERADVGSGGRISASARGSCDRRPRRRE